MLTIAVVGLGEVGVPIARAFLSKGHQVRLLTRRGSKNEAVDMLAAKQEGARKIEVEYGDEQSIQSAIAQVSVIISALNPASKVDGTPVEVLLARVAAKEGSSVKLFIPSMWGYDYQSSTVMHPSTVNPIIAHKTDVLDQFAALHLPWIAISNGLFSSWSLTPFAGIDAKARKAHLKVKPDQLITFSHLDDIGHFVEAVVSQTDKYPSPGTGRWLYVASYHATFSDVLHEAKRIDGRPWTITLDDVKAVERRQQEASMDGVFAWSIASLSTGRAFRQADDNQAVGFTPKHTLHSSVEELLRPIR